MEDLDKQVRADFRNFLFLLWAYLGLPEPTAIQYDIAQYLQHGPRRSVIEGFRGVAKSWITAAYVLWRLYCDPQVKVEIVSASKIRADDFSIFLKQIINNWDFLAILRSKDGQRDATISFDVGPATPDQSPSVKSVGITGQITGSRADVLVADDIEILNNSLTQTMRERLSQAVKEFDAVLKPGGEVVYLGTPQVYDSLYTKLPERGYQVRVWPARLPDLEMIQRMGNVFAPLIQKMLDAGGKAGDPTEPSRFDEADLKEREASYGRSGFRMQFMLDATGTTADKTPLKLADLIVLAMDKKMGPEKLVWSSSPELVIAGLPNPGLPGDRLYRPMWVSDRFVDFHKVVMTIDPSGKGKDETGFTVTKELNGMVYLTANGGLKNGSSPESMQTLAEVAKAHGVNHILVESNFGDGMWTKLFQPILSKTHKCALEEINHTGQKELRIIDTLEPVMNQHRLVVDEEVIRKDVEQAETNGAEYSLFYQLTRITKDKGSLRHDDRLESLAMAVAYWLETMAIDVDKAADASRERAIRQELKGFRKHALSPLIKKPMGMAGRRRKNFLKLR